MKFFRRVTAISVYVVGDVAPLTYQIFILGVSEDTQITEETVLPFIVTIFVKFRNFND